MCVGGTPVEACGERTHRIWLLILGGFCRGVCSNGWVEDIPVEVLKLLNEARRNTQPRKHHIVPSSYLERWAIEGKVRVNLLDEQKTYLSRPAKAARETDYYRVESEDLDPDLVPPLIFETILSRIEAPAVNAIDQLATMPARIDDELRYVTATFMAFQYVRGHRQRLRVRAAANHLAKLQTQGMSDDHIRRVLGQGGSEVLPADVEQAREVLRQLQDGEFQVALQDAWTIGVSVIAAQPVARLLSERPWIVAATHPNLVTTDEPVLAIGGPGSPRTESSGAGVAGLVAFPLNPERVLLAVRRDLAVLLGLPGDLPSLEAGQLDVTETIALSRELVMSATRWAFERPDPRLIANLDVPARAEDLSIEEYASPSDDDHSLIRHFNYTRWKNAELVPDWPLSSLWPAGWRCWPIPESLGRKIEAYRREEKAQLYAGRSPISTPDDGEGRRPQRH